MSESAVACQGIRKIYWTADEEVVALKDVDKEFPYGEVTAIVGPSGSGKSSLLRILACVDRPDGGSITIDDTDITDMSPRSRRKVRRRSVGYMFQNPIDNLIEYLDSSEQVRLAARLRGVQVDSDEIHRLLARLHLEHRADHRPAHMSGGEQQRLAVACSVVGGPAVVVADEPTAELDTASADRVLEAFTDLASEGVCFILSSHDPRVMDRADHLLRLDHGAVMESW